MKLFWAVAVILLSGCTTPFSVSAGFFGASVTANFPEGVKPIPVAPTTTVVTPTLMVPANSTVTAGKLSVTTATGATVAVPVVTAPVSTPVLAVPK